MDAAEFVFKPPRRAGLAFQGASILLLIAASVWNIWQMAETQLGPLFIRHLLLALVCLVPLPLLVYRLRALQRASYTLARDGIRLRWGLRAVDIPMDRVLWIRSRDEIRTPFPLPLIRWPGGISGLSLRAHPRIGRVEYMAATLHGMVYIGTAERVYAISPENSLEFLQVYRRMTELGSLSPIQKRSEYPTFLLADFWQAKPARFLFLITAGCSLVLFAWVSLIIPQRPGVYLGPAGSATEILPSTSLLLFPLLNLVFQAMDWGLGLFFFRYPFRQPLAYLLWGSGMLTSIFFLISVGLVLGQS
jgi:hypothetical protein